MKTLLLTLATMLMFMSSSFALYCEKNGSTFDYTGAVSKPDKCWTIVKNGSSADYVNGAAVALDLTDDDGGTVDNVAAAGLPGHCIMMQACAVGAYCKCQTYGYHSAILFNAAATATAGYAMFMSATAGYVRPYASPSGHQFPIGVFYDTSSTSGTIEGFIKL